MYISLKKINNLRYIFLANRCTIPDIYLIEIKKVAPPPLPIFFCLGTPVISFQLNGTFTPTTYMSHSTLNFVQDGELDDFSLCLRFSLFYLRGFGTPPHTTYFFSYGTENSEDTLTGFIKRTDWVLEPYM